MTDSGSEGIADILTARGEERREWLRRMEVGMKLIS